MTTEATENTPLLEGKITKITGFGAFVELTDGRTGLIHISEIADGFIDDISRYVTEGQEVKVVLVNTDEKGRISLSLKRAAPAGSTGNAGNTRKKPYRERAPRQPRESAPPMDFSTPPPDFDAVPKKTDADFEDMMSKFKARSDEKISDLKKSFIAKRGGPTKPRH